MTYTIHTLIIVGWVVGMVHLPITCWLGCKMILGKLNNMSSTNKEVLALKGMMNCMTSHIQESSNPTH